MSEPTLPIIDLDQIADPGARRALQGRLNLVAQLVAETRPLREANRRLRDEPLRLKGEPGRPVIKPPGRPPTPPDHSSARARHPPTPRPPRSQRAEIVIHRTEALAVDRALLPPDAAVKGDEEGPVHALVFRTDNVRFRKETGYSATEQQRARAPLPPG